MSHFTSLSKANIVDANAFIKAAAELGFTIVKHNAVMRGYQGNTMKADVVVSRPGCNYDVGLVKNGAKYDLISDWWGVNGSVQNADNRFVQLTTKHTIVSQYARQGFVARVSTDASQNIVVTLTR